MNTLKHGGAAGGVIEMAKEINVPVILELFLSCFPLLFITD